jgi:hypothetical protein
MLFHFNKNEKGKKQFSPTLKSSTIKEEEEKKNKISTTHDTHNRVLCKPTIIVSFKESVVKNKCLNFRIHFKNTLTLTH